VSVDTKRGKDPAPLPFDQSTLQEVCSAKIGMGVQETLDVAQSHYETHKATTNQRTESGYAPQHRQQLKDRKPKDASKPEGKLQRQCPRRSNARPPL
ncbi:DNA topoisomerase, partial [Pseudomonas syringae group genomosp. 7]|uniref:DNA topoisomerase n=1 Tax=Pseudomonas syringae group genomosp. 7 TaxID=251699 RepID=UPI0037704E60